MKLPEYLKNRCSQINKTIDKCLPAKSVYPESIHSAMRYVMAGGKRLRGILAIACAQSLGAKEADALKISAGIEMIHAYSLVHDDLPCMDNSDYRRGRLSAHKKFGEAVAVLTGDALLTRAFYILSSATKDSVLNVSIIKELAYAIGTCGMLGGQAVDIESKEKDIAALEYINIHKTGFFIAVSCKAGAMAAKASKHDVDSIFKFGEYIGFVFQIIDDILDEDGFVKVIGKKDSYDIAVEMTEKAKLSVRRFGEKADILCLLADYILKRKH